LHSLQRSTVQKSLDCQYHSASGLARRDSIMNFSSKYSLCRIESPSSSPHQNPDSSCMETRPFVALDRHRRIWPGSIPVQASSALGIVALFGIFVALTASAIFGYVLFIPGPPACRMRIARDFKAIESFSAIDRRMRPWNTSNRRCTILSRIRW
jgi:hypothetical protein